MYFNPVNKQLEEHKLLQQRELYKEKEFYNETLCQSLVTLMPRT